MKFEDGWLERQAEEARKEIASWSPIKREVMMREFSVAPNWNTRTPAPRTYEQGAEDRPDWKRRDKPWADYPVGTKARESWSGGHWTKIKSGLWKWCTGVAFGVPGVADEVALPITKEGE